MRKRVVFLNMAILLAACLQARAAEPSVEITTTFEVKDEKALACPHKTTGSFTAVLKDEPKGHAELIITRDIVWTISPTANVTFAPKNKETVNLSLLNTNAFGKSYGISVVVTWTLEDKVANTTSYKTANDSMVLAAKDTAIIIDIKEKNPNNVRSGLDKDTLKVKINGTDFTGSDLILETVYDPVLVDGVKILANLKVICRLCCRDLYNTGGNTVTVDIDDMVDNHMPQKQETF
ncbi:MAG: hypothetical protein WCJ02_02755 [bacterium]